MKHSDIVLTRVAPSQSEVGLDTLYRPFLRKWRLVAVCVGVTCSASLALILASDREYAAQMVVAAVPNTKSASIAGGLSSLLGNTALGGVQSTPYFITRLLLLRGVLREVALSQVGVGTKQTVIERLLDKPAATIKPQEIDRAMREVVATDIDKQTGLVTFTVTHSDSALARVVSERILASASQTFVKVLRSQASDQREAGKAQVDSARRQLHAAEARLQYFQTTHRVYEPYSPAAIERQRIDRDLQAAQSTYSDAVSDNQNAVARELSEMPAVVVVDPIPPDLTPVPRQAALKLALSAFLGVLVAGLMLLARGEFSPRPEREQLGVSSAA
ncbi:MAG TPA: hypothetical protein VF461_09990 [Gemmatimonadaceae bacterium]